jgi:hypothetical protein
MQLLIIELSGKVDASVRYAGVGNEVRFGSLAWFRGGNGPKLLARLATYTLIPFYEHMWTTFVQHHHFRNYRMHARLHLEHHCC